MAKAQSFGDKVKRQSSMGSGKVCPKCGEIVSYVRKVEAVKTGESHYGFSQKMMSYCKCNSAEVLGG